MTGEEDTINHGPPKRREEDDTTKSGLLWVMEEVDTTRRGLLQTTEEVDITSSDCSLKWIAMSLKSSLKVVSGDGGS